MDHIMAVCNGKFHHHCGGDSTAYVGRIQELLDEMRISTDRFFSHIRLCTMVFYQKLPPEAVKQRSIV